LISTSAAESDRQEWDAVIGSTSRWFDWRLSEIWTHRDLLRLLVWRDFVTVHKQTVLGPLWHVVNPILTALVFTLIFGRIVKGPTDGRPPVLFYMGGMVVWNYFTACFFKTSNSLAGNAGLFGKVYFHRLIVPLSAVISSLISFAIQFLIFVVMVVVFRARGASVSPNLWILFLPLLLILLGGYGLGLGIITSALTARYRDLGQLIGFATQMLMFATPIIYPTSTIEPKYQWIVQLNPLATIVESFRLGFLGKGTVNFQLLFADTAVLAAILIIAISMFTRAERTFLDTV
jgi:lipopolysaccharide transport system permease protein